MYQLDDLAVGGGPLYRQIEKILRARIAGGNYPVGASFPTDAAVCEEFKVSRATVRVALDALQRDGLIVRHPRRGSFVRDGGNAATMLRFNGSIDQIITQGDGAGTAHWVEDCNIVRPSALEAQELKLTQGHRVMRLEGCRMLKGERIGHTQISFPAALGQQLDIRQGKTYASFFRMFEEKLGLKVKRVRQVVSVTMPSRELARALHISVKVPLLVRQRTFIGPDNMPLELAVTSYPGDRYRFEIEIQ